MNEFETQTQSRHSARHVGGGVVQVRMPVGNNAEPIMFGSGYRYQDGDEMVVIVGGPFRGHYIYRSLPNIPKPQQEVVILHGQGALNNWLESAPTRNNTRVILKAGKYEVRPAVFHKCSNLTIEGEPGTRIVGRRLDAPVAVVEGDGETAEFIYEDPGDVQELFADGLYLPPFQDGRGRRKGGKPFTRADLEKNPQMRPIASTMRDKLLAFAAFMEPPGYRELPVRGWARDGNSIIVKTSMKSASDLRLRPALGTDSCFKFTSSKGCSVKGIQFEYLGAEEPAKDARVGLAVAFKGCSDSEVLRCKFHNLGSMAVSVANCTDTRLYGNRSFSALSMADYGLLRHGGAIRSSGAYYITTSNNTDVGDCNFDGTFCGLWTVNSSTRVHDCRFSYVRNHPIAIYGPGIVCVDGNLAHDCGNFGPGCEESAEATVYWVRNVAVNTARYGESNNAGGPRVRAGNRFGGQNHETMNGRHFVFGNAFHVMADERAEIQMGLDLAGRRHNAHQFIGNAWTLETRDGVPAWFMRQYEPGDGRRYFEDNTHMRFSGNDWRWMGNHKPRFKYGPVTSDLEDGHLDAAWGRPWDRYAQVREVTAHEDLRPNTNLLPFLND